MDQQVERRADRPFDGVFNREDRLIREPGLDRGDECWKRREGDELIRFRAQERCLFAERASRPQKCRRHDDPDAIRTTPMPST